MRTNLNVKAASWSRWVLVPLRLFLGVTFVYAGIQKLTDPQYFNPAARGYIGRQIIGFATGSPLHDFLLNVALPHAALFGALVAYGELAIGLGVLLGLFLRPAAFFGLLLNLVFFLSADWRVFPYFYGSDLVYLFGWLTLLLAGPAYQALPALDTWLALLLVSRAQPRQQPRWAACCTILLGVQIAPTTYLQPAPVGPGPQFAPPSTIAYKAGPTSQTPQQQQSRRTFVWGLASGGAAMLALAWLADALRLLPGTGATANNPNVPVTLGSPVAGDTPTGSSPAPGGVIAKISDVPTNSAFSFTLPSNSDPGVLIHLNNGQFVAYNATCTHAGCLVDFDPASHNLVCPCHGASFDPARSAAVLTGPAQTPLTNVPVKINQSAGTVSLGE